MDNTPRKINKVEIDLEEDEDIPFTCGECLTILFPIAHIECMAVLEDTNDFGQYLLVTKPNMEHNRIEIIKQDQYLNEEHPFMNMYLRKVKCKKCKTVIGVWFQTVNILFPNWLLKRTAFVFDRIEFGSDPKQRLKFKLLEYIKSNLNEFIEQEEEECSQPKYFVNQIKNKQHLINLIKKNEEFTEKHLLEVTKNEISQNLVKQIISSFHYFSDTLQQLDNRNKDLETTSQFLKRKIEVHFQNMKKSGM